MGLIIGSSTFTRFRVEGAPPEDCLEEYPVRITRFAFQNIDETSDQERSAGWVNILDMFDNRLGAMEYLKEPCIALSWRVDFRKVPSRAVKRYCREAEEKIKEEEGLEFLSKKRRRDIKERVQQMLMKRVIPGSQTYDMIWDLRNSTVIFGSVRNNLCDEFAEFFMQCFGLRLKPVFPYSAALQVVQDKGMDPTIVDTLRPSLWEDK
jgi:DNA recombination-dependent growth factor C